MKNAISTTLIVGLISLTSFKNEAIVYEQIAFNYFVSDVLVSDFKSITAIAFKGETEDTYSTLGKYKVCLKPEEKLQSIIEDAAKGKSKGVKQINYDKSTSIAIVDADKNTANPQVKVYPAVRVAESYYVFVSLQQLNESAVKYVFEINPDGKVSRSCRML